MWRTFQRGAAVNTNAFSSIDNQATSSPRWRIRANINKPLAGDADPHILQMLLLDGSALLPSHLGLRGW
jgi:hypothetical protein